MMQNAFVESMKTIAKLAVDKAGFDKTRTGNIVGVNSVTNTYSVKIDGIIYNNVKTVNDSTYNIGDIVKINIPMNNPTQAYITSSVLSDNSIGNKIVQANSAIDSIDERVDTITTIMGKIYQLSISVTYHDRTEGSGDSAVTYTDATYTAILIQDGEDVTSQHSSTEFSWYLEKITGRTSLGTGTSVTLSSEDYLYGQSVVCEWSMEGTVRLRDRVSLFNNALIEETIEYLDNGVSIATDQLQYFWFDGDIPSSTDKGAHVTFKTKEDFQDNPANGGLNLYATALGLAIRNGTQEISVVDSNGFHINGLVNNNWQQIADFSSSITLGYTGDKHLYLDSDGLSIKNDQTTVLAYFYANSARVGALTDAYIEIDNGDLRGGYNSLPTFTIDTNGVGDSETASAVANFNNLDTIREVYIRHLSYVYLGETFTAEVIQGSTTETMTWTKGTSQTFTYNNLNCTIVYDGNMTYYIYPISGTFTGEVIITFTLHIPKVNFTFGMRKDGTYGDFSFAVGLDNIASGKYSCAFGSSNEVRGEYSYAEGFLNTVNGDYSHAEGYGQMVMGGNYAHAEGRNNFIGANAYYSHLQNIGNHTIVKAQTVIGTYNLADTVPATAVHPNGDVDYGNYALIIGNGTGNLSSARSNALTVDWNGNIWSAGAITISNHDSAIGTVITASKTSSRSSSTTLANLTDAYIDIPSGSWIITLKCGGDLNSSGKALQFEFYNSTDSTEYISTRVTLHTSNNLIIGGQTTLCVALTEQKRFYCRCYQNSGSAVDLTANFRAIRIA